MRLLDDEPRRAPAGLLARVKRLPARACDALLSSLTRSRLAPGRDDGDLWLLILASDPDGIWYPLPNAYRKPPYDDAAD
jgi:hypothetical protein